MMLTHMYPPPHIYLVAMMLTHMYPPPHIYLVAMMLTHMYPPPHIYLVAMMLTHMYPPPHMRRRHNTHCSHHGYQRASVSPNSRARQYLCIWTYDTHVASSSCDTHSVGDGHMTHM
jgi:hypothetical protein